MLSETIKAIGYMKNETGILKRASLTINLEITSTDKSNNPLLIVVRRAIENTSVNDSLTEISETEVSTKLTKISNITPTIVIIIP